MALFAMFLSGIFGAISNLCLRKNMEKGGAPQAFFSLQLFLTAFVLFLLFPLRKGVYYGHPLIFAIAIAAGFLLKWMKTFLAKALEHGPPSMSFAVLNCATLFPIFFLSLAFSHVLYLVFTPWHALGSILMGVGLFWAGWDLSAKKYNKKEWFFWISCAFLFHLMYLLLKEWRCLLFQGAFRYETLLFFRDDHLDTLWFAPWIFFSSAVFHFLYFFQKERRWFTAKELRWGTLGGFWNGICSFFFTLGPEMQTPLEAAFLFPTFALTLIVTCNLWGERLYHEAVHWKANLLCFIGLAIGTAGPHLFSSPEEVSLASGESGEEKKAVATMQLLDDERDDPSAIDPSAPSAFDAG